MANEEQLEILKQRVDVWNKWRENNKDLTVKLDNADLSWANLSGADLSGAKFQKCFVSFTIFGNVDLSGVEGLDDVNHLGPSSIGIDTIYKSKGKIPEIFLRKAGVPKRLIEYIPSLITGEVIQFYSCFISYSNKDKNFADRLYADLQHNNIRCWYALMDMEIGARIRESIDNALKIHDKLLIVLSKNSINSKWVEKEVETAFDKESPEKPPILFPIRLDNAVLKTDKPWAADIRRIRHIGDFSKWKDHDSYQNAFKRLLRDLKAEE